MINYMNILMIYLDVHINVHLDEHWDGNRHFHEYLYG